MKVPQAFYGRGAAGYEILGASVSAQRFLGWIGEVCRSVGTPGYAREGDDKPFLIQRVRGPNILMACAQNGSPDALGRKTLLFHVLILETEVVKTSRISAFDVYAAKAFSSSASFGEIQDIDLPDISPRESDAVAQEFSFPAVVRCRRADNLSLAKIFGGRLVVADWATMSWCQLEGCDWFGLDEATSIAGISEVFSVYDLQGRLLRSRKTISPASETREKRRDGRPKGMGSSMIFGLIGLLCGLTLGRMIGSQGAGQNLADGMQLQADCDEKSRSKFPHFNEDYRIVDFSNEMKRVETPWNIACAAGENDEATRPAREAFRKLEEYVNYVNQYVGSNKTTNVRF